MAVPPYTVRLSQHAAGLDEAGNDRRATPLDLVIGQIRRLLGAHEAAADPHAIYATDGDLTAHAAAADPHTGYQRESEKGQASGYASLDGSTKVPLAQLPTGTTTSTVALGEHAHASASGEVLMTDGIASPPEPIWTEDGTDWLYEG